MDIQHGRIGGHYVSAGCLSYVVGVGVVWSEKLTLMSIFVSRYVDGDVWECHNWWLLGCLDNGPLISDREIQGPTSYYNINHHHTHIDLWNGWQCPSSSLVVLEHGLKVH